MSESTEEKRENRSSRDIQLLQGKISLLDNKLQLIKILIESLVAQRQTEYHSNKMAYKHTRTNSEKTEVVDKFTYSMISPDQRESMECQLGLTKKNASLDTEEYDENEEHLHYTELQTDQQKKEESAKDALKRCILSKTVLLDHRP